MAFEGRESRGDRFLRAAIAEVGVASTHVPWGAGWLGNVALVLLAFWASRLDAAPIELITNGSFEVSSPGIDGGVGRQIYIVGTNGNGITGWTLSGVGDIYLHRSPEIGNAIGSTFNFAQNGNVYLDLSGGIGGGQSGNHATISQAFATIPSTSYALSFFVGAAFTPLASIHVSVTGVSQLVDATLTAPAPSSTINWGQQTFLFTADSTSTTLSFRGLSGADDNASFVDSVSVLESTSVPEIDPAGLGSVLALLGGSLGVLERRRRRTA